MRLARFAWLVFSCLICPLDAAEPELSAWRAHDLNRPRPLVVTPSQGGTNAAPPSDAIVLFDGTNLDAWTSGGGDPKWVVQDGAMMPAPESGPLQTRKGFGDIQLHIEWASPNPPAGSSQGRGNSGVYLMTKYEVQILDSYENPTYADGQAASIYGQNPPMANATLPPGEWQVYDIIFRRPRFDEAGGLVSPATVTVLHNGVLVQDHFEFWGPTNWLKFDAYQAHPDRLPLQLQDHGNPVRFRNIWLRELAPPPTAKGLAAADGQVELSTEQLDRLTGDFDGLRVRRVEDRLELLFHGRWFELAPHNERLFSLRRTFAAVRFELDETGQASGLELDLMGSKRDYPRR